MKNGLYAVEFIANGGNFGAGIIAVRDGSINGGDGGYYYQGHFDYYGTELKSTIQVTHHSGPLNSVLGALQSFSLILSGTIAEPNFVMTGGIPNVPNVRISIRGRKVADLV